MVIATRICDLCSKEMTDYIPQVQILGKPRGGWRFTGYTDFNDICQDCHDKILERVLSLREKGAAFRMNNCDKEEPDIKNTYNDALDKKPHYKRHLKKVPIE